MTLDKFFPDVDFLEVDSDELRRYEYFFKNIQGQSLRIAEDKPLSNAFFKNFIYHFLRKNKKLIFYFPAKRSKIPIFMDTIIKEVLNELAKEKIFLSKHEIFSLVVDGKYKSKTLYSEDCDHSIQEYLRIDIMMPNDARKSYGRESTVGKHFIFSVEGFNT